MNLNFLTLPGTAVLLVGVISTLRLGLPPAWIALDLRPDGRTDDPFAASD